MREIPAPSTKVPTNGMSVTPRNPKAIKPPSGAERRAVTGHTNYSVADKLRAIGPAVIVTGSFIGPGTVTTATRTGADFGYAVLWSVVFAIIATIVLQEMAARIGIVTRRGLSKAISGIFTNKVLRGASMGLVGIAIP